MSRLVVVAHRVAADADAVELGGQALLLAAVLRNGDNLWFGWGGGLCSGDPGPATVTEAKPFTLASIDIPGVGHRPDDDGYANAILWPLVHLRIDLATFERRLFQGYRQTNAFFAQRLMPLLRADDEVWVHDYALIPLGEELRNIGYAGPIGFFLHVPFPVADVLTALFNHRRLMRALLTYDLVGFQTPHDLENFTDYARRELGAVTDADADGTATVTAYGRTTRLGSFPVGIDTQRFARMAVTAAARRQSERLARSLHGRQVILSVDRLDYTKGLPERFAAIDRLLGSYPENRGQIIMLQIAPPVRTDARAYSDIRQTLEAAAGRINGTYSTPDWVPIRYVNRSYTQHALAGMYRSARVGLVTPLRDGMNLVAKEYVASQSPEDPGVLVLSRFAGAAHQLDAAVIVNPYDTHDTAEAVQRALTMPLAERRERWRSLYATLKQDDVHAWGKRFRAALRAAAAARRATQ